MSKSRENAGHSANAKSKILVIDDESDLRAAFKTVLGDEGFTVITAADGLEGVRQNKKHDPDVIILDLKMPNMGGMETLKKIRETDKKVRVIILTGYGEAGSIREAENLDVFEYASKPFRNATIIGSVKEALIGGR